jgi:hypothetical protein
MLDIIGADLDEKNILAISFISRMSFIMLLFHTFIFIFICGRTELAAYFHDGLWGIKFLLVGVGYFASFFIDNKFFDGFYLPAAKIVSIFYLIYQALLMLIWAYKVNEILVRNYEKD